MAILFFQGMMTKRGRGPVMAVKKVPPGSCRRSILLSRLVRDGY